MDVRSGLPIAVNATEPQTDVGQGITIDSLTFSFRSGASATFHLVSAPIVFPDTSASVGNAGFLLGLDAGQQALLTGFLQTAGNIGDFTFGLDATLSGVVGGPETFRAVKPVRLGPSRDYVDVPIGLSGWVPAFRIHSASRYFTRSRGFVMH